MAITAPKYSSTNNWINLNNLLKRKEIATKNKRSNKRNKK